MPRPSERSLSRYELVSFLGAFCLFLSAIEYMIPKPLPFMRLGISNLPLILAIDLLPPPFVILLAIVKTLGQCMISGSLISYVALFSLAGSLASALAMLACAKVFRRQVSLVGVSLFGAFASNAIQMILARFFIFGEGAWLIAPPFIALGILTGFVLGLFCERFKGASAWYARVMGEMNGEAGLVSRQAEVTSVKKFGGKERKKESARKIDAEARRLKRRDRVKLALPAGWAFAAGILGLIGFFTLERLEYKLVLMLLFLGLAWLAGKRLRPLSVIVTSVFIVAFNLLVPIGKVIASPFGIAITDGALLSGIDKALTIEGLLFLSLALIRPELRFPGRFGAVLSRSFAYFDRIAEYKGSVERKKILASIDSIFIALYDEEPESAMAKSGLRRPSLYGLALILLPTVFAWAFFVLERLSR